MPIVRFARFLIGEPFESFPAVGGSWALSAEKPECQGGQAEVDEQSEDVG